MTCRHSDVRAIIAARRSVRLAVNEPPTRMERLAARISSPTAIYAFAAISIAWALLNARLASNGTALDPYPFRWLQRSCLVVGGIVVLIAARASKARRERAVRRTHLCQELVDAFAATRAGEPDLTRH